MPLPLISNSINYNSVCSPAPATPGLLDPTINSPEFAKKRDFRSFVGRAWRPNRTIHRILQSCAVQYRSLQCGAVQCFALQCNVVQCSTIQYSTVQSSTVQYNAI